MCWMMWLGAGVAIITIITIALPVHWYLQGLHPLCCATRAPPQNPVHSSDASFCCSLFAAHPVWRRYYPKKLDTEGGVQLEEKPIAGINDKKLDAPASEKVE
jgi:hypothetical protein